MQALGSRPRHAGGRAEDNCDIVHLTLDMTATDEDEDIEEARLQRRCKPLISDGTTWAMRRQRLRGQELMTAWRTEHDADVNLIEPAIFAGIKFDLPSDKSDIGQLYLACKSLEAVLG